MPSQALKNENSKEIIKKLFNYSIIYYKKNKRRIVCILLSGSLGRGEEKSHDVDLYIITRFYYDVFLTKKFLSILKSKIKNFEINVGLLPLSRLKSGNDKSHYLYDLKYNSKLLAGEDIRSLIPEITIKDFYPFEGFLLLLNRSIDLIRSIENFTAKEIVVNEELFETAASRIRRACMDAYLIFNKQYHPNYHFRTEIFHSIGGQLCEIKTYNDARRLITNFFNEGLKITRIKTYKLLLKLMSSRYQYPLDLRIYTFIKTRKLSAFFRNPIYNVYEKLLHFIFYNDLDGKNWTEFKKYLLQSFKSSPSLCLLSDTSGSGELKKLV